MYVYYTEYKKVRPPNNIARYRLRKQEFKDKMKCLLFLCLMLYTNSIMRKGL